MSWDLVKSLNSDDENIPNYDESSSSEEEFQPKQEKKNEAKKKKLTKAEEFSQDFDFVASVGDYNTDPWTSDIQKYIKRKAKTKTDDKIAEIRREKGNCSHAKLNQKDCSIFSFS